MAALSLLTGCSWLYTTHASGPSLEPRVADINIVCSTDLDNRNPADPFAYSLPAFTPTESGIIAIGGADARAHMYDHSCHEISRTPLQRSSDSGTAFLSNGLAVLGDTNGILYAIQPVSGAQVWTYPLSAPLTGRPIVIGDDVLVQTLDNRLYRIDAKGQKKWSFSAPTTGLGIYLTASPLVQGDRIYTLFSNGDAFAIAAATGDVLWRKQLLLSNDATVLDEIKAPIASPVALQHLSWGSDTADHLVLFSFYQGDIVALNADDGRMLFSKKRSLRSSPVLDGDSLIVADSTGLLQAVNTTSGQVEWSLKLSQTELIGPTRFDSAYWVADIEGRVYRVSRQGKLEASIALQGEMTRPLVVAPEYGVLAHTNLGALYLLR